MKTKNIFTQLGVAIGILFILNLISTKLYFRLDFTEDQRYTLSKATKNIITELKDVVTIKAYFSQDLPPQIAATKQDFNDLLIEFEKRSNGNIVYEFINPNENEETEKKAQQSGINPLFVNVTERDQVKQIRAYMGAVIQSGNKTEIIPVIQPGSAMEYALTTSLKKISIEQKAKVGFIQGHKESPIEHLQQLTNQLSVLYTVEPINLPTTPIIDNNYKALVWINPEDSISADDFSKINNYLNTGKGIFIAYANIKGNLQTGELSPAKEIGMETWLAGLGIQIGKEFLIDASCAPITVQQRQGNFVFNSQVQFPYFPIIKNFANHSISKGLESIVLPFASAINITRLTSDSALKSTNLLLTSENTGLIPTPNYVDIQKQWTEEDFKAGKQAVAIALSGKILTHPNSKIVIASNGIFAVSGDPNQQQQINPDNVNFTSNSIDWIADDTGLIDLRTKGVTNRPLDKIEEATKNIIKYSNVLAPIILLLIYGFIRKQRNVMKREKWTSGQY
ncbi:MAG: Gldg family protein [Chitinophagaceae bacterium]|nr:Gldg family protein [Chitinophagaceae bacterium]